MAALRCGAYFAGEKRNIQQAHDGAYTVNMSFLAKIPRYYVGGRRTILEKDFHTHIQTRGKILRKCVDGKGGKTLLARRVKKTVMVFTLSYTTR